ncbi:MAG TPA: hypothetical protein V6D23_19970, partial [Candidatus Obscuribacterales bacterium]
NQVLSAHITRISPVVNPQTRLVKLTAVLDTPAPLRSGMLLDCSIVLEEKSHALMVPIEAVVHEENKTLVYTVVGSKVEARSVKLGLRTAQEIEVRQGLNPKDQVIIRGTSFVRPGDKVQVQKAVEAKADGA